MAITQRLHQVLLVYGLGLGQVGNGAADPQYPMIGANREAQLINGIFQHVPVWCVQTTVFTHLRVIETCIDYPTANQGSLAGFADPLADQRC